MAWASEDTLNVIKNRLKSYTLRSLVKFGDLHRELEQVREQGYAINRGEWREQVVGVAAPIYDSRGLVVAALGISGPTERLDEDRLVQAGGTLMTAAAQISRRLGYSGG